MKKRLLSWLLVLVMIFSLIPSTLITSALAAGTVEGDTTYYRNELPSKLTTLVTDIEWNITAQPNDTITVADGQTLIVHGTGGFSNGGKGAPLFEVQSGGHLVLDQITITTNTVGATGAVYVHSGGLLDLGYNDQSARVAPGISGNTTTSNAAKNLVVADGATVRLNAAADKKIGVTGVNADGSEFSGEPISVIEGGRYTIRGNNDTMENQETMIEADSATLDLNISSGSPYSDVNKTGTKLTLQYVNDHLVLAPSRINVLVWDPIRYWNNYEKVSATYDGAIFKLINTLGTGNLYGNLYRSGSPSSPRHMNQQDIAAFEQFDMIVLNYPTVELNQEEINGLNDFLCNGGRIFMQFENPNTNARRKETIIKGQKIANALKAEFEIDDTKWVAENANVDVNDEAALSKGLTSHKSGKAGYIFSKSDSLTWIFSGKTTTGETSLIVCDQNAGDKNGEKWGALTICGDGVYFDKDSTKDQNQLKNGKKLLENLLQSSRKNRLIAATGVNPNAKFNPQATTTTTTTTDTTPYRTPYAALQKAVETNTITLLTESHKNTGLTPTRDELLFEKSTLAYEQGSTYAGSKIHADTVGVYLDITKTGEVNLHSGTVTVTPNSATYPLVLNGTMDQDGTAITGGYKITSGTAYTLDADDATSPILTANGGGASITIPNAGESVTVDYGNGTKITYTATKANDKFYLGHYVVTYEVNTNAIQQNQNSPYHGETFTQVFEANAGYELEGGCFSVYRKTRDGGEVKINLIKDDALSAPGQYTVYSGEDTSGNDTVGSLGKVTVKQIHLAGDANVTGGNRNGNVEVKIENVRSDIVIKTEGEAVKTLSPIVTIKGTGTDKAGAAVQHYNYAANMTYKDGLTTRQVKALPIEKYRLVGVKVTVKGVTTDGELVNADGTHTGNADEDWYVSVDLTQGEQTVEFQYAWNMADVTIKATFNGQPFPGYTEQVVEIEQNKLTTIHAPNLSGYEPDRSSQDYTANGNTGEVTFDYTRVSSELIYKAVDQHGNELGTYSGGTILRGEAPRIAAENAPKLENYMLVDENADGTPESAGTTDVFDGTNAITVTFVYKPRTKTVSIYMVEYTADGDHKGTSLGFDNTTYKDITTGQTLNITAPAIAGYSVKAEAGNDELSETKSLFVTNDTNPQSVYFYYVKDEANAQYITVKMMDGTDTAAPKLISSFKIPGVAGQAQMVTPPELHGYVTSDTAQTVKPDEELVPGQGNGVVIFNYTRNMYKVDVKLVDVSVTPEKELSFPTANYPRSYEVVKGDSLTLTAPSIYGYTLKADTEAVKTVTPTENTTVTFKYEPIDKQLVTIHVKGMIEGEADARFNFTETVPFGTQSKDVAIFNIPGYKLKEVTVASVKVDPTPTGNTLSVVTANAQKGNTIDVVLIYESNMANVTVQAKYNTTVMQSYTLKVEKGTRTLISAPAIPGYTATETSKNVPVDADTTVDFEYTKDSGNVTVVAVEKGSKELFRQDAGTVTRGDKLDLTGDAKAPGIQYYTASADPTSVVVNGQPVADIANYTYTGIGDVVVTYEYTRNLRDLVIIKKDVATNQEIPGSSETLKDLKAGESHTFLPGEGTAPSGYEVAPDRNPSSFFVEDKADQQVVFWYKNTSADQYMQITVNLKCGGKVFQTYPVTAVKGVETTVMAPTVKGYTIDGVSSQPITPDGTAAHDTLTFNYTITNAKTVKVVLKDNTNESELNAPSSYTKDYTLKDGDSLEIWAPAIDGYTLAGATLGGTASPDGKQLVKVDYANLTATETTVTFSYTPVTQANFVTHTIRFVAGTNPLYTYDKMIAKGAGTAVPYSKDDVKSAVPGYSVNDISYEVNSLNATAADVTDAVNAVITYHFVEDAATITVKKVDGNSASLGTDTVLTGYRQGQTIQVIAPVMENYALNDDLIKTVTLNSANVDVTFKYVPAGNVTFTLLEKAADGTSSIIEIVDGENGKTYDPSVDGNPLNLTKFGYTYVASDDANDAPFNAADGKIDSLNTSNAKNYNVYYTKDTRTVTYIPVNKTALDEAGLTLEQAIHAGTAETDYKINVTPAPMDAARVLETYKAVAQSFNGWTLKDDFSKVYTVEKSADPLKVYFLYEQKTTGTITVNYYFGDEQNQGELINQYTVKAVAGEKLEVTALEYLLENKYRLRNGQTNPVTIDVTDKAETVNFYYEANFVTVTTNVVLDGRTATVQDKYEAIKDLQTSSASLTLTPPNKAGYTLVGITATGATLTDGSQTELPTEYANNALTLEGLTTDATVTYYYKETKASEYQTTLKVQYKYNGYDLLVEKAINVNTGETTAIDIPSVDGYKATSASFVDGAGNAANPAINGSASTVDVKPTEKTATLTITYERTDGSIVLPGKDGNFTAPANKDNVTVTPDDAGTKLTPNPAPDAPATEPVEGSVTVPADKTATVNRPVDPDHPENGSEDITVPGGTTINPDGTIILPNGDGKIDPDQKIPKNLPNGYFAITYDSNNSNQEVKKEIGKAGVLKVSDSLFTDPSNRSFAGWNDSGSGNGKTYAKDTTVSANITLYAVWDAQYRYSTNIIYKANDGTTNQDTQLVGHATDPVLKGKLQNSPFQVSGWTFGGWNEAANGSGTLYQPGDVLTLENNVNKTLFAQWFKKNADDSITIPGSDGNPNNPDTNATGNGNGTDKPSRNDKGEIEIPKGGSVTLPDGSVIGMPDGGKLLPDGTVIINRPDTNKDGKSDGTITIPGKDGTNPDVTDKDGKPENKKVFTLIYDINNGENDEVLVKVVEGDAVSTIKNPFTWAGHIFLNWMREADGKEYPAEATVENVTDREIFHAQWAKVNPDGSIELPGKDGILDGTDAATGTDHSKDNVTVTPADPDKGGKITPQPDGSVKVEDSNGGTVNRPKDSTDLDAGREDIKVPNGTVVDPDGTIHLPDNGGEIEPGDKLPDATPNGYVSVVYKANGGTGDDVIVVVKSTETINTIKNPFKKNGETFSGWNTAENGINGTAYGEGAEITGITGKSVTLYAQWTKSTAFKYSAKLIYLPNDGTREANKIEDTVGANDSQTFSENLRAANTFTVTGWTFGGWNTAANGSGDLKAANAVIEVTANVNQTFHAQWYKTNADGSITVPGKDGNPNTAGDNVTANGNGNPVTRDDATGNIEIPAGGSVITPNGEIALPDGGILKPDGTVIINLPDTNNNGKPDNTITVPGANGTDPDVKDENGNTDNTKTAVVLTYQANNGSGKEVKVYTVSGNATKALAKDAFTYSGHKFLYWQSGDKTYQAAAEITPNGDMTLSAVWAKVNPDGSIELPGENGKLEAPHDKDNVIVTPDNKGGLEGPKDDGSVEVKPDHDATVTRPDPDPTKPDTKEDVKVPAGTVILPDGTIKLPAPDNTEIKPGDKIPETTNAYVTVTFEAGNGTGSTIKQIVNKNSKINLLDESAFTAPDNHFFVGWKDADGKSYDAGVEYDVGNAAVTFIAQYQDRDNLTKAVAIFDYAGGTDINGNGSKYITGKADAAITGIADPTRTGYTFAGWGNADLKFGASGSVTKFTAQWTIKSYNVTFDVGDDTKGTMSGYTAPVKVEYGKSVASADIPSIAAIAGNVFVGWLNSSDNSVYTADSLKHYAVTGDVTFTAQYVDASLATVIFVYAGGTLNGEHSKLITGTEGSAIGTLPEPDRDGYTLTGWSPAITADTTFGAAGSVTVYTAQWDENEKQTFTVTFDIDATKGSTADTTTETVADGGFVTKVPTVTAKAGYRFVGWMDQDNKLFYEAGLLLYPITKNTTFTAQFEEVTANPGTATVIFDANGGKIGNNSVLTKVGIPGTVVGVPTEPTRDGYRFLGWSGGFNASTVYGAESTTQTYTAQWETIEYTIHFSATGASGATADQTYKFDGTTKNTLNRNGFTLTGKDFLGWSLTDGATSAEFADGALINDTLRAALAASNGSITLYAVWADGVTNTLTVTGSKATAKRDETVDFTAYLNGVATNAVTWIVTGGQNGTSINKNGVLTIGSNESNGTVLTVTAIYKNDTSLTASATVRVVVNSNNNGGNNGGGTVSSSFVIKANAGNGGIISPSGNVSVKRGDDQTFVINPVNGYRIADVIVDGKSVGAVSLYTFENVRANHTIEVVFTKLNSIVADPTETGVAGWLQTREHIAYLGGYGNGLFGPNDNMTRAQVAQMFYNLLLEKDIPVTTSFSDVPADAWYAKAVNTLASLGIIKGIGNDQFAPNRTITRAEFTVIAMRFANVSATVTNPFSDIASSDWYYTAVTSAVSYGWINGYSDGTFKPMATITRAEVATIVNRMLARTADRTFVDSSAVTRFDDVPATYWAYYNIAEATTAHTHTIDNDGVESWGRLM